MKFKIGVTLLFSNCMLLASQNSNSSHEQIAFDSDLDTKIAYAKKQVVDHLKERELVRLNERLEFLRRLQDSNISKEEFRLVRDGARVSYEEESKDHPVRINLRETKIIHRYLPDIIVKHFFKKQEVVDLRLMLIADLQKSGVIDQDGAVKHPEIFPSAPTAVTTAYLVPSSNSSDGNNSK